MQCPRRVTKPLRTSSGLCGVALAWPFDSIYLVGLRRREKGGTYKYLLRQLYGC